MVSQCFIPLQVHISAVREIYVSDEMVRKDAVCVDGGYVCAYGNCGRPFKDLGLLRQHLYLHYNKKKDITEEELAKYSSRVIGFGYLCKFGDCGRKIRDLFQMRLHLRTHFNIKPYKCSYCQYAACQKNALQSHVRNNHKININISEILEDFSERE